MDGRTMLVLGCGIAGGVWVTGGCAVFLLRLRSRRHRGAGSSNAVGDLQLYGPIKLHAAPLRVSTSRGESLVGLADADDPGARELLRRGLWSSQPEIRRASVTALGQLACRHEWAVDGLIEALAEQRDTSASLARRERQVLTVRDVSHGYRRERRLAELCSRDPETALLDERGFEERVREAVRSALADGTNPSVVVLELGSDGPSWSGGLGSPEALLVIDRLQGLLRAGDELARMRDEQIAWLLPESGPHGAVEAVSRARRAISDTGTTLTAGVCDFATAGDAPSLYALADQALAEAKRQGRGTTASYTHGIPEILPSDAEHRARP